MLCRRRGASKVSEPPVRRCAGPAGEAVVAQALRRSASTERIVRSLSQHDEAFRRRLRWAGKHELAFIATASAAAAPAKLGASCSRRACFAKYIPGLPVQALSGLRDHIQQARLAPQNAVLHLRSALLRPLLAVPNVLQRGGA